MANPSRADGRLASTAYSRAVGSSWLGLLEPWVRRFRTVAFGEPVVPFPEWPPASRWIEIALRELDPGGKAEEGEAERRALEWRENPRGVHFRLPGGLVFQCVRVDRKARRAFFRRPVCGLEAYGPDLLTARTYKIQGFTDRSEWSWPPVADPRIPPVVTISNLTREWAELTGVPRADLVLWVLAGVPPTFPRIHVAPREVRKPVPDGTDMTSRRVLVEIFTPDLTWNELQGLHRQIRDEWRRLDVPVPPPGAGRHSTFTEADRRLLDVVGPGGVPERLTREWLQRLSQEWNRRGGQPRSLDAHRKHCKRLRTKERRGVLPRSTGGATPGRGGPPSLP